MKVTVLGNSSTTVTPGGACSSYLLESCGKKILLDAGNGSLFNLKKILSLDKIDAIVLTHHHFDHISDLFLFRYEREALKYMGQEVKPIPLYTPKMEPWLLEKLEKNHIFEFYYVEEEKTLEIFGMKVSFIPVEHLVETYALRFEKDGKVFTYSADTGMCEGILKVSEDADLFLCEATYVSKDPYRMKHHLHGKEAGEIAKTSRVKKLLLTHLPEKEVDLLLSEAKEIHKDTEISEILLSYGI